MNTENENTITKPKKVRASKPQRAFPDDFDGLPQPQRLWKARRFGNKEYELRNKKKVKGILHLPGRGSATPKIMFLSPSVLPEEVNVGFTSQPGMLRGPAANLFLRCIRRHGFKDEDWFYTALCKYPCEKQKPNAQDIRWNELILKDEIATLKPKIIVCLGKPGFDYLLKLKFKLKDIQGGFFRSEEHNCLVFPMDNITTPLYKPEHLERFIVDIKELKRELNNLTGKPVVKVETSYSTIENTEQLGNLMQEFQGMLDRGQLYAMGVDCEWHGQTAWGGTLRSLQLSWKPGVAAYIKLTSPVDGKSVYTMDRPLPEIRPMLQPLRDPRLKFIGHNIAADGVWMEEHLEIPMYQRVGFDTMFAQQALNEYADLKLERNAVKYTDLGRYDIPLLLWKKKNKFEGEVEDGYGLIPDNILIPYSQMDVDGTFRMWPIMLKQLQREQLTQYYFSICLPFVTDGFMEMMRCGLPIDVEYLEKMRETFSRNREILGNDFRKALYIEACETLRKQLMAVDEQQGDAILQNLVDIMEEGNKPALDQAFNAMKDFVGPQGMTKIFPLFLHWRESQQFNINSTEQLRRWLFEVKGFEPLKTTKKDGVQMAWERVKILPAEKQANYTPAADKQTIKVLSSKDPLVARIEELKLVGNIVKAFLGGEDEDGKEQGLFKWVQPDNTIRCNFALTETARPRAWKPNILNWPKAISKPVETAFSRINKKMAKAKFEEVRRQGWPTVEVRRVVKEQMIKPTSVRSAVTAPEGFVINDNDLKTAEVVALAYVAGDENMIRVLTEPDKQFARISIEDPKKVVRIAFNDASGYPQKEWDERLVVSTEDPRILRDNAGCILHPKRDIHWELGETIKSAPREKCDERMDRDGSGKVGNFSVPYGSAEANLDRLIEANTGRKPTEGTGAKILEAYQSRYPVAWRFLESMEQKVENPGWYRSISGRVRHFFFNDLSDVEGLSDYSRNGILSPLTRQARNFPIQELVAATTAKALIRFIKERNDRNMRTQVMVLLYDAITLLSPIEEAKMAAALIKDCMTIWTPWTIGSRTFNFETDTSFNFRWGVKMTKSEKSKLEPYLK